MVDIKDSAVNIIPETIRNVLPRNVPLYLVGGAVRDVLVGRKIDDFDFVMPDSALKTARIVANALQGDFFVLDNEREIGRVIIYDKSGDRRILDFALQRKSALEEDLRGRDFTINAMAIDANAPQKLIDPLGGSEDLRKKVLRTCTKNSIQDDPIRIMRAVRMASSFQLRIQPETLDQIRSAMHLLGEVSGERIRDELFRIFDTPGCATSIRALDKLGVIDVIFPELIELKNTQLSMRHHKSKWEHTLEVLRHLEALLAVLGTRPNQELSNNLMMGLVSIQLGKYRAQLNNHLNNDVVLSRSARQLLNFSVLFHQIGIIYQNANGDITIQPGIMENSIREIDQRLQALYLSNHEVERLFKTIRFFFPPNIPLQPDDYPSRRDIYRFYKSVDGAGIEACLLHISEKLARDGMDLSPDIFTHQLGGIRKLFEAWWDFPDTMISPALLINGNDLMQRFDIAPGPLIGEILSEVKEAQAAGELSSRAEAFDFAEKKIHS